jgi:predicted TIM-barrel fold metal-dependent hydrolase
VSNKIDVHQHVVPPSWVERLKELNSRHRPPHWTPEGAIDWMDSRGIATGLLSLTAPGFEGWDETELRPAARKVNDYTAGLVSKWPTRFGNFAILPLPDIDGAIEEATYALDTLGADGVVVFSNYGERYLGDPLLEPLWAELDRRGAVVFVHPTRLVQPELKGIPAPFVDFPFATTRAAVEMVWNGVLDRYQRMKVILSHGGGFLPYAAYRFASFRISGPPGSERSPTFDADLPAVLDKFRRFYFDTALSSSPTSLPSLKAFADPSHLLFGSDYPYGPGGVSENFTAMLDESALLTTAEHEAIDFGNAAPLFPRLMR